MEKPHRVQIVSVPITCSGEIKDSGVKSLNGRAVNSRSFMAMRCKPGIMTFLTRSAQTSRTTVNYQSSWLMVSW